MGRNQNGEGRFGAIVALVVVVAVGYLAVSAGPVYLAHYQLKDKMMEIARMPRGVNSDEKLLEHLDKYLRQENLSTYVGRGNFRITTNDSSRQISVAYERSVKFLPGIERVVAFEDSVDQVLIF